MSSKVTKVMTQAIPKLLPPAMMQVNPKFLIGKPILTIVLYNLYIQNNKTGKDIIVQFKDHHFLVGYNVFIITFSDLYDIFILDVLDISSALLHIVSPQKLASSIYMLYVSNKFGMLHVGTCNNKLFVKRKRSLMHILTHKW
jgi:hypothetical protein